MDFWTDVPLVLPGRWNLLIQDRPHAVHPSLHGFFPRMASRMVSRQQTLIVEGVSLNITAKIAKTHMAGTQWLDWCFPEGINLFHPIVPQFKTFLKMRINTCLTVSVVMGYQTICGGAFRPCSQTLATDAQFCAGAACLCQSHPLGNLGLFLHALLGIDATIDAASLKSLAWKTWFLVGLASGCYLSEIHVLSGVPGLPVWREYLCDVYSRPYVLGRCHQ